MATGQGAAFALYSVKHQLAQAGGCYPHQMQRIFVDTAGFARISNEEK